MAFKLNEVLLEEDYECRSIDTPSTISRGMEMSLQRINELTKTIDTQRKIIAEQAAKIHELQSKFDKTKRYYS